MLYRGVRLEMHRALEGRISPRGDQIEVVPRYDGTWSYDGTFTYGYSEDNAARAHHIENGKWGGCFVSTTRNYEVAKYFATTDAQGLSCQGVVYFIDDSLFDLHGVVSKSFDDPLYPEEEEVSIRASDAGDIPTSVIVDIREVGCPGRYIRQERDEDPSISAN